MSKVAVIGAGSWGTAMAVMLSQKGHDAVLWARKKEQIDELSVSHENKRFLPGVMLPDRLGLSCNLSCIMGCDIVVIAVPSAAVREVSRKINELYDKNQVLVSISKGLEEKSHMRMSQVIGQEIDGAVIAVLSGPSHAEEVSRNIPTTNVASSSDIRVAQYIQDEFMNPRFRIYTTTDMVGVELGGSLKNIIAICAGICDGMGFGDNTKAALMTRGIAEMSRLGVVMGAKNETFGGLSGIGDLIVTCTSKHSRNRRFGILVGQGVPVKEAILEVGMVVEGYATTKAAYDLSRELQVEMPIVREAYEILYNGKDHRVAMADLMERKKKNESEDMWVNNGC